MYALTECQQLPSYRTFISYSTCKKNLYTFNTDGSYCINVCVSWVAEVATSRKVSRSVSLGRMQDDVNSLSNTMRGRVSTYLSRLPTESQNRWQAPFRLFNRAASAAAGVEVQWYSGEYVCEPCCAMVIICLLVSSRPLFLCYVILVCYTPVLDSFLPHWRNEVKS
jgi:hypothetical protein